MFCDILVHCGMSIHQLGKYFGVVLEQKWRMLIERLCWIIPILTSIDSTTQNIRDMGRLITVTKLSL